MIMVMGACVIRGLVSAIVLAGCGRISFDAMERDTPTTPDVPPALGPFGTPVQLAELDVGGADDPALTWDELEIMFSSDRAGGVGGCDVWTARRPVVTASWSAAASAGVPLNGTGCDSGAMLSRDGLTVWIARGGATTSDLFEAHRDTRTSPWQSPIALTALSSGMSDSAPTVTADALTLMFHSNRSGSQRLYITTRASIVDPWTAPTLVGPLTTGVRERSPHLSADGTTLWFISNALGTQDLWMASRPDRSTPFGTPTVLTELSSADSEDDPWISEDGHRIYFARYPTTGLGTLWIATR